MQFKYSDGVVSENSMIFQAAPCYGPKKGKHVGVIPTVTKVDAELQQDAVIDLILNDRVSEICESEVSSI